MATQSKPINDVEIQVNYDRTDQTKLAVRAGQLSADIAGVIITDQYSLELANVMILAGNDWLKAVDRIMDPVRDATHKAWKAAIKAQEDFKGPVERPLAALKTAATRFVVAAQEATARIQAEKDAEQIRKNLAEAKRVAAELKALGASKAEIKEAQLEVKSVVAPTVQPEAVAAGGQSIRMLYSAEITDMKVFIKHLANDEFLLTLLGYSQSLKKALESELRGEAIKRKETYSIPGTKLVKTPSGAWRG
jgi:hypothetical protein